MKLPLLVLTLTASRLIAQTPADPHEADRAALRELGARYEQAINEGKLTGLADALLPEMSAVFATGDEVRGMEAMQKFYDDIKTKLGDGSTYSIKMLPDRTDFFGDTAVAHGKSDEHVRLGNGTELDYQTLWTAVLLKQNGQWKAARLHVSLDPVNNPFVAMKTKWRDRLFAAAGLALGLLLWRLFVLERKRRAAR
jgi:ketosteroid isomerase-like protein